MPNFEVYRGRRRGQSPRAEPAATITQRGIISLNRSAYALMGEPVAVELLYDRTERIIGLRPVAPEVEHAYPVRPQGGKPAGPFQVHARLFTQWFDIDVAESRRRTAAIQDGVLCIDLKQGSGR